MATVILAEMLLQSACASGPLPVVQRPKWASGQAVWLDYTQLNPISDGFDLPTQFKAQMVEELDALGLRRATAPTPMTPVISKMGWSSRAAWATVSVNARVIGKYEAQVGDCVGLYWGSTDAARRNLQCLQRGLLRELLASEAFVEAVRAAPASDAGVEIRVAETTAPDALSAANRAPPLPARTDPSVPAPAGSPVGSTAFVSASPQPAAYALVIGIERYRDVPAATGARADAETFAQVARQTLGLRDDHVRVAVEDHATRTDILGGLDWLKANATAGGRVYFFFSGHGAPSTDSSTYLLPYDGDPRNVAASGVAMSEVMKRLGETKAKEALAFFDSCFSGAGGRSVLPPGARPLMRVHESAPAPRLALMTASSGDEISGPALGESGGVFTKYLTQALGGGQADANGDGQVSLKELSDWVTPRVARDARQDKREQHPKLVVGSGVGSPDDFIVEWGVAAR